MTAHMGSKEGWTSPRWQEQDCSHNCGMRTAGTRLHNSQLPMAGSGKSDLLAPRAHEVRGLDSPLWPVDPAEPSCFRSLRSLTPIPEAPFLCPPEDSHLPGDKGPTQASCHTLCCSRGPRNLT